MADRPGTNQGKLEFLKQILHKDKEANVRTVNQAWHEAGREGRISESYVGKVRARLGLTKARTRSSTKSSAASSVKSSGRAPARAAHASGAPRPRGNGSIAAAKPAPATAPKAAAPGRSRALESLEGDLDRLLFSVMDLGGLPEVEHLIRRTRRLVILEPR
jgi:hypothetical protein